MSSRKHTIYASRFSLLMPLVISLVLAGCSGAPPAQVRQPVRIGDWYSEDPQKLGSYMDGLLTTAGENLIQTNDVSKVCSENPEVKENVIALICPHVSYKFSGLAAAHAYKTIQGHKYNRVFILGPMHSGYFSNALLPSATDFATPFGTLPVDTEIVKRLRALPVFRVNEKAHDREFSIEMQLPFVRRLLGPVKIVPIIIGNATIEADRSIADALLKVIAPGDLVIVSSDFTHYGPQFNYLPFRNNVSDNIEGLDKQAYSFVKHQDADGLFKFQQSSGDPICGIASLCVLLDMLPENTTATLLDYYTSQDVKTVDGVVRRKRNWSVSYMGIAFSNAAWGSPVHAKGQHP